MITTTAPESLLAAIKNITNTSVDVSSGSGTITIGNTAQNALASDANGYHYLIQNNSSNDIWFSTLSTAVLNQPSIRLVPGAVYETPDSLKVVGALSVIGTITGQAFTILKWS